MIDPKDIFPVGIGTWGIGGFAEKDPKNNDKKQIEAMSYMLKKGTNFAETCYWYSEGHASKLLADAILKSGIHRTELFLVASLYPYKNPSLTEVRKEFELLLELYKADNFDSVQFTMSGIFKWGIKESINFYNNLLKEKLVNYVSVTNLDIVSLKIFKKEFGSKLFSHELHFSFEIRENEEAGITDYADKNNIRNVIFQSLRRNMTAKRNWPLLVELAAKYKKTQNQIILRWMVQRGFILLVKSEDKAHIDENMDIFDFEIDNKDFDLLNRFRVPGYKSPKVDWNRSGNGVAIHTLPNIFDEEYGRQQNKK